MEVKEEFHTHRLSPSSWNRFEECPRKYWLSRRGLPRKASMPASLGTAIHNSMEDLCNLDLSGRDVDEVGWLPPTAKEVLDRHWQIERDIFLGTPRHPRWKSELINKAHDGLAGALNILFTKAHIPPTQLPQVSVGTWRDVQKIILSNEGTLVSDCGRLMGRLDLLISDIQDGKSVGWIVADLKTGNPPKAQLNEKVSRQLRFYRDLLKQNNPDHPPVLAEGWYSANQTIHRADGPPILTEALEAWEGMRPTEEPLQGTPSNSACAFCEWKAWCPTWWVARRDGELAPGSRFRDEVVRLVRFDEESGASLFERTPPIGDAGELAGSNHRFGAILRDQALEQMRAISSSDYDGPLFLGSARVDGKIMHLGDWSEVLPWSPILGSAVQ
ncbi:MAG: PD-(D/E)XK nuclease family protein [Candidatus Thalassarchaeaceae archaeon]|jgi:hypothetical protein|nr:PD-(D/E)XK nuclease family protein [Candidatus Thalassarchaeaceae archaeon]MDP6703167.1 PD-(D/E)XK nuclease family protein [Candidatus Thalassarchaeaceae archaeon]MDP7003812.1 PD-(D/E)XK nuclease family protein [Candidatus Thalassarchaeaceae archaeon]